MYVLQGDVLQGKGVFRARAFGDVMYCYGAYGVSSGIDPLFAGTWTPDEREAIAKDLRECEASGALFHSDGSGKAGRPE